MPDLLLLSLLSSPLPLSALSSLAPLSRRRGERSFKTLFELVPVRQISLGIEKGIWISGSTLFQLRKLLRKAIELSVRADPDLGRQRSSFLIRGAKVFEDSRILFQRLNELPVQAALDQTFISLAVFFKVQRPCQASSRVTRHHVRRQRGSAERDLLAVVDQPVNGVLLAAGPEISCCGFLETSDDNLRPG